MILAEKVKIGFLFPHSFLILFKLDLNSQTVTDRTVTDRQEL